MEASDQLHAATALRLGKKGPNVGGKRFEEEENLTVPEFESRSVSPVASRYTDFVTPAAVYVWNRIGCHSGVTSYGNRQPDKEAATSLVYNHRRILRIAV
jgi:hypothetical protein